jgi:hypothetical protein
MTPPSSGPKKSEAKIQRESFLPAFMLVSSVTYSSTLKMEATSSS